MKIFRNTIVALMIVAGCASQAYSQTVYTIWPTVCSGVEIEFAYSGSCPLSLSWQVEGGSYTIVRSNNNSATIRWSGPVTNAEVIARCTSNSSYTGSTGKFNVYAATGSASVSITGPAVTCFGHEAVYTATAVNGGSTPTYNWKVNGIIKQSGSNAQYRVSGLQKNDVVTAQVVSSIPCLVTPVAQSNAMVVYCPDNNYNYIITDQINVSGKTTNSQLSGLSTAHMTTGTVYYDGLGRPMQTVDKQFSPLSKDMIKPVVYDEFGRQHRDYLPAVVDRTTGFYQPNGEILDATTGSYKGLAGDFYAAGSANKVADDRRPFSEKVYEKSPLEKVVTQYRPGQEWLDPNVQVDRRIRQTLLPYMYGSTEDKESIIVWMIDASGLPVRNKTTTLNEGAGYYPTGSLLINTTVDEDGNAVREYVDKEGRVILKKVQAVSPVVAPNDALGWAQTYYIYDNQGLLRYVLQPELSRKMAQSTTANPAQVELDRLAFQYRYDYRLRMVEKAIPDAAVVYMVYDKLDRLVLTQDGNQRANMQWTFTKYDRLNRPILNGIKDTTASISRDIMQQAVDMHYAKAWARYGEEFVGYLVDHVHGYSNRSYPVATSAAVVNQDDYVLAMYYDNYDFRTAWHGSYLYVDDNLQETAQSVLYQQRDAEFTFVQGRITGTKTKVLDGDARGGYMWLKTGMYYDDRGRIIQTVADNYKGGVDRQSTLYDFAGKVLKTQLISTTYDITWTDFLGTRISGKKLYRNISNNTWGQSGAASKQVLPAGQNGWIEVTATETTKSRMIGLSAQNTDADYTSIDYAFYLRNDGALCIREKGSEKKVFLDGYKPGDVLRIARIGAAIKYYRNGTELYPAGSTVTQLPSSTQLLVDVAFSHSSGTLVNVRASFVLSENTLTRRFVYDHAGRLLETYHQLGGATAPEVLLARQRYNELGQPVDKDLHSVGGSSFKQSVDYRYNIRGWLTSINNASLSNDGVTNDDATGISSNTDYFGMNLLYNTTNPGIGNTGRYNGNISGVTWSRNQGLGTVEQNAYVYNYDAMNRLKDADFKQLTSTTWVTPANRAFSEREIHYDLNGNILSLIRQDGRMSGTMDDLIYTYGTGTSQSNQLLKVADAGDKALGFADGLNAGNDYTYDANGNIRKDFNKGIGTVSDDFIAYNLLNLPETVTKGDVLIRYVYDASGRKLAQQVGVAAAMKQTDYMGNFVYENDVLQFINHEEGRVVVAKTKMVYTVDADELNEVTAKDATLSAVTLGSETYIKAIATSTARPGIFPVGDSITVHAGERYKIRARAYRLKGTAAAAHAMNLLIQVNGNDLGWPGALVPGATTTIKTESWIEQEVIVPVDGTLVAGIVGNSTIVPGEELYLNAFEIIKLEDTAPEYQYFIKDHLGNVRLTFTSTPAAPKTFTSDFEAEDDDAFENYSNSTYDLVDHTDIGTVKKNVQKLNGGVNGRVGVAKAFAVMPGDVISARAYGKYMNVSGTANTNLLITSLAAAFGVSATSVGDQLSIYEGLNSYADWVEGGHHGGDNESAPKAFVTILFFDKDHNLVDAAWDQMTTTGAQTSATVKQPPHDELSISATAPEAGYAYVFVSNEHPTFVDVYYDDVTFTHTPSAIVAMDDYYPFGMNFNSAARQDGLEQRYLYNGKEKQDELSLEWLDYGARMYMTEIGRWLTVDPLADDKKLINSSPYSYVRNNPVILIDPNGMKDTTFVKGKDKEVKPKPGTETPIEFEIDPKTGKVKVDKNGKPIITPKSKGAYNCHSYAWHKSKGDANDQNHANDLPRDLGIKKWDNDPSDDIKEQKAAQLSQTDDNKPGDKVIYFVDKNGDGKYNSGEVIEHSAVVTKVDARGNTTEVTGKMGQNGISTNHPDAPGYYKTNDLGAKTTRAYFRTNP